MYSFSISSSRQEHSGCLRSSMERRQVFSPPSDATPGGQRHHDLPSVLSPKYEVFCCDQNGPPARREEGAYLNRYVTDEQRSRRPVFIATLWAGASWLFFRVARSTRMTKIWALRSRLEKQPTDLRQNTSYFGDRTLAKVFGPLLEMTYPIAKSELHWGTSTFVYTIVLTRLGVAALTASQIVITKRFCRACSNSRRGTFILRLLGKPDRT